MGQLVECLPSIQRGQDFILRTAQTAWEVETEELETKVTLKYIVNLRPALGIWDPVTKRQGRKQG